MMERVHTPVLLEEVLTFSGLDENKKALMADMNLGEGGHTLAFLKKYPHLDVIGVDIDSDIEKKAVAFLGDYKDRFKCVNSWSNEFLRTYDGEKLDLILFDLGLSMFHFKESERGFSFKDESLDMRLDKNASLSAYTVVNTYSERKLADVLYEYGGETKSFRIAKAIVERRKIKKIETASELHSIIESCFPMKVVKTSHTDVATRSFQAIRIEVNDELNRFKEALKYAYVNLKIGGRIEVISFHSLEDGIAKWYFRSLKDEGKVEILTKKPLVPETDETAKNNASRSSKLRVVKKVG